MEIYTYIFVSVLLVSLTSFVGVFAFLFSRNFLYTSIPILVSLAAGAMLGDAFIHLIPEMFEESANSLFSSILILLGLLLFFVLEKFLHWHHSHGERDVDEYTCCEHTDEAGKIAPAGKLVLISDGLHNFIDGVVIAASFFVSIPAGIATSIAVFLHEVPQEFGDFGVLLHAGFSKRAALVINFLSGALAFLGAFFAIALAGKGTEIITYLLPIAAGGFIYIASADLIPELHKTTKAKTSISQFIAFTLGIAAMVALVFLE